MKRAGKRTFLRRAVALSAAAAALWTAVCAAQPPSLPSLSRVEDRLARGVLRLELTAAEESGAPDGWTQLLVLESPLLSAPPEEVETAANAQPTPPETQPTAQPQPITDSADASAPEDTSQSNDTPDPSEPAAAPAALDLSAVSATQLKLDNHTKGISAKVASYLKKTPNFTLQSAENGPQILIMHTHATEAYRMEKGDTYEESDPARTTDPEHNMLRVGEEMKTVFESMGFSVLHDTTTYDYPGYNGSYGRSLRGVQSYLDQYPTIQIVLDVHRDALIDADGTAYAKTTEIDGQSVAQVMLVCGTNDGGLTHPSWQDNLTLAAHLQRAMLAVDPSLPRPIDLRSQRFNQHLTAGSLLVEVGTSGNTLREALEGARRFAWAAGTVYAARLKE